MKHTDKAVDYKKMTISSPVFEDGGMIPVKYSCEGENVNPPLDISGFPEEAVSLAIIMEDPDAPAGTWVHWLVWNIPVTHHIKEDHVPGKEGINDFQKHKYGGPCPPKGTHRYFIKIYALNATLDLPGNTQKKQLEKAMSEHIIGFGELIGLYKRNR